MLSAMNVVPGRGVDFTAVAHTLSWALLLYLVAALLIWIQARLLNVLVQRTLAGLRTADGDIANIDPDGIPVRDANRPGGVRAVAGDHATLEGVTKWKTKPDWKACAGS